MRKLTFETVRGISYEEAIQVNYLSTALLTILLLPILKAKSPAGSPSRLTIAGAALALAAKFPNKNEDPLLPSFDDPKTFNGIDRYNTSKLLAHIIRDDWKHTSRSLLSQTKRYNETVIQISEQPRYCIYTSCRKCSYFSKPLGQVAWVYCIIHSYPTTKHITGTDSREAC